MQSPAIPAEEHPPPGEREEAQDEHDEVAADRASQPWSLAALIDDAQAEQQLARSPTEECGREHIVAKVCWVDGNEPESLQGGIRDRRVGYEAGHAQREGGDHSSDESQHRVEQRGQKAVAVRRELSAWWDRPRLPRCGAASRTLPVSAAQVKKEPLPAAL